MMAAILGALVAPVLARPVGAQTAAVAGLLVNRESKSPVEGARVSIVGTSLGASSDPEGRFQVTGVPAGVRVLQVRAVGYAVGSWVVQLDQGQNFRQIFELLPRTVELDTLAVEGSAPQSWRSERGFEERRRRGLGVFITREQIQQRNAQSVTDLLRTVPGLITTCGGRLGCQVRMSRSTTQCLPDYFLDGYPATFSTGPTFPIIQIRGVEVYHDRFETPPEFQQPNQQCGVIAIWTVEPGGALGRH